MLKFAGLPGARMHEMRRRLFEDPFMPNERQNRIISSFTSDAFVCEELPGRLQFWALQAHGREPLVPDSP